MNHSDFSDVLQLSGWTLTVIGQVQIARKRRAGFLTWIVANCALIALNVHVALWWSAAMNTTNLAVCVWSFRRWSTATAPSKHEHAGPMEA